MEAKTKWTKKKVSDIVGYVMILGSIDKTDGVINNEQLNKLMKVYEETFGKNEEKAVKFLQVRVAKALKELEAE